MAANVALTTAWLTLGRRDRSRSRLVSNGRGYGLILERFARSVLADTVRSYRSARMSASWLYGWSHPASAAPTWLAGSRLNSTVRSHASAHVIRPSWRAARGRPNRVRQS